MPHRIDWGERAGPAVNARRKLPVLVIGYFTYVRELLAKDPSPSKLHRLRLATKRLRYTLELFRPCYGPGLETRMAELRRMQQLLGEMNDCSSTERLVSKAMKKSPQRARAEKFLNARAGQKAQEFRKQWTQVFDAPGRERWWTGYLGREARAPGRGR
jgi:CHAD domain-containing protein